jgi:hypothetical protein
MQTLKKCSLLFQADHHHRHCMNNWYAKDVSRGRNLIITVIIDAGLRTAGPINFFVGFVFHRRVK